MSKRVLADSDEEGDAPTNIEFFKDHSVENLGDQRGEEGQEDGLGEIVDIDFSLRDFLEKDYHAVKLHLKNFPDKLLPMHELADAMVGHIEVGATLRAFEEVVGFGTILNCELARSAKWFVILERFLNKKEPKFAAVAKSKLGLLIHFRMINLPQKLGGPVQVGLKEDVEWTQTKECSHLSEKEKEAWKLDNVAVLCKRRRIVVDELVYDQGEVTKEDIEAGMVPPANKKRKTIEHEFLFEEDKIYQSHATMDVIFGSESTCSIPGDDLFHLFVMPFSNWLKAIEQIEKELSEKLNDSSEKPT